MKNIIYFLIPVFLLFSCRNSNTNESKKNLKKEKKLSLIEQQSDIYIGKKFYEGDELNFFSFNKSGFLTKDSIISYSVYEDDFKFIYSIEKQISNEDVREYLILDTLQLKKINYGFESYPLTENIILKDGNSLYKYDFKNGKIIKPN